MKIFVNDPCNGFIEDEQCDADPKKLQFCYSFPSRNAIATCKNSSHQIYPPAGAPVDPENLPSTDVVTYTGANPATVFIGLTLGPGAASAEYKLNAYIRRKSGSPFGK